MTASGYPHSTEHGGGSTSRGGHQTIDRVTQILEELVYRPGLSFAELTRAVGAPKSSMYGFVQGLIAADWLFLDGHRLYPGPAFRSLAVTSGTVRVGSVTAHDLEDLHRETGLAAFLGVRADDHLIYVAEAGSTVTTAFDAQTNIRQELLSNAAGRVLLAALPQPELEALLERRRSGDPHTVAGFAAAYGSIRRTGVAIDRGPGRPYNAVATILPGSGGAPPAAVTLIGPAPDVLPRAAALARLLRRRARDWQRRSPTSAREML